MSGLTDTHCHIHAAKPTRDDFTAKKWQEANETDPDALINSAIEAGVDRLICVGTDLEDSLDAVDFVQTRDNCRATIGTHPHEAKEFLSKHKDLSAFEELAGKPKVAAIGEVGLDYYYEHSPKKEQIKLLEMFLQLATDRKLPVIFHIREAFDDFWPIVSNFGAVGGVLHSYTSDTQNLDEALNKGLYIGLNGIMTFTRDENQLKMAKRVPLDRLVVETDAPYLTPKPLRGKVCKPQHVRLTAEFLSELRGEPYEKFAEATSNNAGRLFNL
ncbi:MAG TPA: TatD family hydrolase [Candidatus Saccharimonadales bacterium]|nr:TatD family hydrolase [Candidatus Saccharimonadales bacterium]